MGSGYHSAGLYISRLAKLIPTQGKGAYSDTNIRCKGVTQIVSLSVTYFNGNKSFVATPISYQDFNDTLPWSHSALAAAGITAMLGWSHHAGVSGTFSNNLIDGKDLLSLALTRSSSDPHNS